MTTLQNEEFKMQISRSLVTAAGGQALQLFNMHFELCTLQ
jgi:hypothetical protein